MKCLGLIKDMVVTLAKIPYKTVAMDFVVADIPPNFGVLVSRSWTSKLKGSLHMDMSYVLEYNKPTHKIINHYLINFLPTSLDS